MVIIEKNKEEKKGKKGIEKGIKQGRNDIIKQLLKTMTPKEVSEKLEIPLKEIKLSKKY